MKLMTRKEFTKELCQFGMYVIANIMATIWLVETSNIKLKIVLGVFYVVLFFGYLANK